MSGICDAGCVPYDWFRHVDLSLPLTAADRQAARDFLGRVERIFGGSDGDGRSSTGTAAAGAPEAGSAGGSLEGTSGSTSWGTYAAATNLVRITPKPHLKPDPAAAQHASPDDLGCTSCDFKASSAFQLRLHGTAVHDGPPADSFKDNEAIDATAQALWQCGGYLRSIVHCFEAQVDPFAVGEDVVEGSSSGNDGVGHADGGAAVADAIDQTEPETRKRRFEELTAQLIADQRAAVAKRRAEMSRPAIFADLVTVGPSATAAAISSPHAKPLPALADGAAAAAGDGAASAAPAPRTLYRGWYNDIAPEKNDVDLVDLMEEGEEFTAGFKAFYEEYKGKIPAATSLHKFGELLGVFPVRAPQASEATHLQVLAGLLRRYPSTIRQIADAVAAGGNPILEREGSGTVSDSASSTALVPAAGSTSSSPALSDPDADGLYSRKWYGKMPAGIAPTEQQRDSFDRLFDEYRPKEKLRLDSSLDMARVLQITTTAEWGGMPVALAIDRMRDRLAVIYAQHPGPMRAILDMLAARKDPWRRNDEAALLAEKQAANPPSPSSAAGASTAVAPPAAPDLKLHCMVVLREGGNRLKANDSAFEVKPRDVVVASALLAEVSNERCDFFGGKLSDFYGEPWAHYWNILEGLCKIVVHDVRWKISAGAMTREELMTAFSDIEAAASQSLMMADPDRYKQRMRDKDLEIGEELAAMSTGPYVTSEQLAILWNMDAVEIAWNEYLMRPLAWIWNNVPAVGGFIACKGRGQDVRRDYRAGLQPLLNLSYIEELRILGEEYRAKASILRKQASQATDPEAADKKRAEADTATHRYRASEVCYRLLLAERNRLFIADRLNKWQSGKHWMMWCRPELPFEPLGSAEAVYAMMEQAKVDFKTADLAETPLSTLWKVEKSSALDLSNHAVIPHLSILFEMLCISNRYLRSWDSTAAHKESIAKDASSGGKKLTPDQIHKLSMPKWDGNQPLISTDVTLSRATLLQAAAALVILRYGKPANSSLLFAVACAVMTYRQERELKRKNRKISGKEDTDDSATVIIPLLKKFKVSVETLKEHLIVLEILHALATYEPVTDADLNSDTPFYGGRSKEEKPTLPSSSLSAASGSGGASADESAVSFAVKAGKSNSSGKGSGAGAALSSSKDAASTSSALSSTTWTHKALPVDVTKYHTLDTIPEEWIPADCADRREFMQILYTELMGAHWLFYFLFKQNVAGIVPEGGWESIATEPPKCPCGSPSCEDASHVGNPFAGQDDLVVAAQKLLKRQQLKKAAAGGTGKTSTSTAAARALLDGISSDEPYSHSIEADDAAAAAAAEELLRLEEEMQAKERADKERKEKEKAKKAAAASSSKPAAASASGSSSESTPSASGDVPSSASASTSVAAAPAAAAAAPSPAPSPAPAPAEAISTSMDWEEMADAMGINATAAAAAAATPSTMAPPATVVTKSSAPASGSTAASAAAWIPATAASASPAKPSTAAPVAAVAPAPAAATPAPASSAKPEPVVAAASVPLSKPAATVTPPPAVKTVEAPKAPAVAPASGLPGAADASSTSDWVTIGTGGRFVKPPDAPKELPQPPSASKSTPAKPAVAAPPTGLAAFAAAMTAIKPAATAVAPAKPAPAPAAPASASRSVSQPIFSILSRLASTASPSARVEDDDYGADDDEGDLDNEDLGDISAFGGGNDVVAPLKRESLPEFDFTSATIPSHLAIGKAPAKPAPLPAPAPAPAVSKPAARAPVVLTPAASAFTPASAMAPPVRAAVSMEEIEKMLTVAQQHPEPAAVAPEPHSMKQTMLSAALSAPAFVPSRASSAPTASPVQMPPPGFLSRPVAQPSQPALLSSSLSTNLSSIAVSQSALPMNSFGGDSLRNLDEELQAVSLSLSNVIGDDFGADDDEEVDNRFIDSTFGSGSGTGSLAGRGAAAGSRPPVRARTESDHLLQPASMFNWLQGELSTGVSTIPPLSSSTSLGSLALPRGGGIGAGNALPGFAGLQGLLDVNESPVSGIATASATAAASFTKMHTDSAMAALMQTMHERIQKIEEENTRLRNENAALQQQQQQQSWNQPAQGAYAGYQSSSSSGQYPSSSGGGGGADVHHLFKVLQTQQAQTQAMLSAVEKSQERMLTSLKLQLDKDRKEYTNAFKQLALTQQTDKNELLMQFRSVRALVGISAPPAPAAAAPAASAADKKLLPASAPQVIKLQDRKPVLTTTSSAPVAASGTGAAGTFVAALSTGSGSVPSTGSGPPSGGSGSISGTGSGANTVISGTGTNTSGTGTISSGTGSGGGTSSVPISSGANSAVGSGSGSGPGESSASVHEEGADDLASKACKFAAAGCAKYVRGACPYDHSDFDKLPPARRRELVLKVAYDRKRRGNPRLGPVYYANIQPGDYGYGGGDGNPGYIEGGTAALAAASAAAAASIAAQELEEAAAAALAAAIAAVQAESGEQQPQQQPGGSTVGAGEAWTEHAT